MAINVEFNMSYVAAVLVVVVLEPPRTCQV